MSDNPYTLYAEQGQKCYTVKEITYRIKNLLESEFPTITVEGEISNFRPSSTGHFYFSLKDNDAMLSTVMFKGRSRYLTFTPADGMLVKAKGNISVYPKRGNYQLICESMEKAGVGEILVMSSGASSLSAMTCRMTKSKTSKLFWILAFYPGNAFPEITAFLLQERHSIT